MARRTKLAKAKEIKDVKAAMALKKHATITDAYIETHPHSSPENARKNAKNMLTPEVVAIFKDIMKLEEFGQASRPVLEKVLFSVVARWYAGLEKTADLIATVRLLTMLVPAFQDRLNIQETDSEDEIDKKLKEFGIDPKSYERN
jgi:hypothetical protein